MPSLEAIFEHRAASDANAALLENLGILTRHVLETTGPLNPTQRQAAQEGVVISMTPGSVPRDRQIDELAGYHQLLPEELQEFAAGGRVLDVGAGISSFLDEFSDQSETIAVDRDETALKVQADKGHRTIHADGADLDAVEPESVRLYHATYSLPYWADSEEAARAAAVQCRRVLEVGGIALVGPVVQSQDLVLFEVARFFESRGDTDAMEAFDEAINFRSRILAGYTDEIIGYEEPPEYAGFGVVGNRSITAKTQADLDRVNALIDPSIRVPNYLMIRRP